EILARPWHGTPRHVPSRSRRRRTCVRVPRRHLFAREPRRVHKGWTCLMTSCVPQLRNHMFIVIKSRIKRIRLWDAARTTTLTSLETLQESVVDVMAIHCAEAGSKESGRRDGSSFLKGSCSRSCESHFPAHMSARMSSHSRGHVGGEVALTR